MLIKQLFKGRMGPATLRSSFPKQAGPSSADIGQQAMRMRLLNLKTQAYWTSGVQNIVDKSSSNNNIQGLLIKQVRVYSNTSEKMVEQQQEQVSEQVKQEIDKEPYHDDGEFEAVISKVNVEKKTVPTASYGHRIRIGKLYDSHEDFMYKIITVAGWARTVRAGGKDFCFIELTDGSSQKGLQVVVFKGVNGFDDVVKANIGTSFQFKGTLIKSPAKGQLFELQLSQADKHKAIIFGNCDAGKYPLHKSRHSVEYLREIAHLRPRTNLIGAVTRVRNNLAYATHKFFQERGFLYIHTPIITASDCEGAGQMFQVTTVLPQPHDPISKIPTIDGLPEKEEEKKDGKQKKKDKKKAKKQGEEAKGAEGEQAKAEDQPKTDEQVVQQEPPKAIPFEERLINYKKDLFGKPSFLTVSGQLNVENYCCALSDVYTFGPTFRAENSHTSRHLAEFWMIEPELAFATLPDNMQCAEDYLKYCLEYVLVNNKDELEFFDKFVEKGLIERLTKVVETPFKRVAYTEGIEILETHIKEKKVKFDNKVYWGVDLASEHEKYLTDKVFEGPIILYNYPKDIKAFYMKLNTDGKTVQAMDVLVPRIGELIGGSAREENLELLDQRIADCKLEKEAYWWYRQLREYGTIPHTGFGLGFERLVMMATGVENIRDVIPFPRAPGTAEF